jgi:hypothetical protein
VAFNAGQRIYAADLQRVAPVVAYKTGDTPRNLVTAFTSDPDLVATVVANAVYAVQLVASVAIGAGGFRFQFTFPSGTAEAPTFAWNNGTIAFASHWLRLTAGASPAGGTTGMAAGAAGGTPLLGRFALFVGATGGTLALQWAQDSSNAANTTIAKGSYMTLTRLA